MSITNITYPSISTRLVHSAYRPAYYIFSSTKVASSSYYAKCDINTSQGIIFSSQNYPLTNSYHVTDPHRIIENKLSYDFNDVIVGCQTTNNSIIEYLYTVSESIISNGSVTYYDNSLFNKRWALNTADEFDMNDYILDNDGSQLLTTFSGSRELKLTDSHTMGLLAGKFNTDISRPYFYHVKVYTDEGTTWKEYRYDNTYKAGVPNNTVPLTTINNTVTQSYYRQEVGTGPFNINKTTGSFQWINSNLGQSGSYLGSIIDSNTVKYEVWFSDDKGDQVSIKYPYRLHCPVMQTPLYRVSFLNSLGSFEYFNCAGANRHGRTVTKNNYKTNPYLYASNSYPTLNSQNFYNKTIENSYTKFITCNTGWITQGMSQLLEEFFTSPTIFIKLEDGLWYSCQLLETDYNRQIYYDGLINYTFTLELSQRNNSQRG